LSVMRKLTASTIALRPTCSQLTAWPIPFASAAFTPKAAADMKARRYEPRTVRHFSADCSVGLPLVLNKSGFTQNARAAAPSQRRSSGANSQDLLSRVQFPSSIERNTMSRVQMKTMTWLAASSLLFSLSLPSALGKPQADTSTQQTTPTTTTKTTKKKATSAGSASASEIAAAKAKGESVGQP